MTAILTVLLLMWLLTPAMRFVPMLYLAGVHAFLSLPQSWGMAVWVAHALVAPGLGYIIALANKRRGPAVGFALMLGVSFWVGQAVGLVDIM